MLNFIKYFFCIIVETLNVDFYSLMYNNKFFDNYYERENICYINYNRNIF